MTIKRKTRPHAAHDDGVFEQGITALTILSRLHGRSVAPDEVRKLCKRDVLDVAEMVRCGRKLGLRVRGITIDWSELSGLRLPALAALRDGKYLLLGQLIENRVVAADLTSRRPKYMTREELEAVWGGRVIAMIPRKTWKNYVPKFSLPKFSLPKLPIPKFSAPRRVLQFLRPARLSLLGAAVALYPTRLLRGVAGQWLLRERAEDGSADAFARPAEEETPIDPAKTESALLALTILLRCHGIGAEPDQIRHRIGSPRIGVPEMLRCARDMELKARLLSTRWERLASTPLPGIAVLRDGTFLILGKVAPDKVLVQRPTEQRPDTMTREEFEAIWTSELILATRRASLSDLSGRFDISWFMGAIGKYRRMLVEVMTASLFLQLFALISPLFFQVIIDKVLVHRSLSTLDVLAIGLVASACSRRCSARCAPISSRIPPIASMSNSVRVCFGT